MTLTATILGCGSSGGVPRIGNDWGSCDPAEPRNYRRRCSLLVEKSGEGGNTRVIIDTSPDFREQALRAEISSIDGVWYTHDHADHTHGIDELRGFYLRLRRRIPVWADRSTLEILRQRFAYCFHTAPGSEYPPVLEGHLLEPGGEVATAGAGGVIKGRSFLVSHGNAAALGFRIAGLAYTPDLNGVPDASLRALSGLDCWIVDALRRTPHSSHFHLEETLRWIERMKPKRAILTNLHSDMDFATLASELPSHVKPAYDGLKVEIQGDPP